MPVGAAIGDRLGASLSTIGQGDDLGKIGQQVLSDGMYLGWPEFLAESDMLMV